VPEKIMVASYVPRIHEIRILTEWTLICVRVYVPRVHEIRILSE
jgi:hypothetical protein